MCISMVFVLVSCFSAFLHSISKVSVVYKLLLHHLPSEGEENHFYCDVKPES